MHLEIPSRITCSVTFTGTGKADPPLLPQILHGHVPSQEPLQIAMTFWRKSRVPSHWHQSAPSAFMGASYQVPWTSLHSVHLNIPEFNPLPLRVNIPCSTLSWRLVLQVKTEVKSALSISAFSVFFVSRSPTPFISGLTFSLTFLLLMYLQQVFCCHSHPSPV